MGARSRRKQERPQETQPARFGPLLAGGIAFGAAATPLVSSEGFPHRGAELPLAIGWLILLLLWGVQAIGQKKLEIRWSLVETLLVAMLAWLALSTWFVVGKGAVRPAINSLWDYVHLAVSYFLIRQVIVQPRQVRALVVVMVGIAAGISAYAVYQNRVELPQMRQEYYEDPEGKLVELQIDPTPGNPMRVLYESRLQSTEVTGTFTLGNSFSAFLVPWLLVAIGWIYQEITQRRLGTIAIAGLLAVALISVCLVLAESRASWISAAFGLSLLAIYGTGLGSRVSWKLAAALVGLPAILAMLGFALGLLDVELLRDAPKSLLYRLQYWEGASHIIARYPWVGGGLANFQRVYPEFMLPMASETVADPHNFVFELWANAGTPAIGLLLAGMVVWALKVGRESSVESSPDSPAEASSPTPAEGGPTDIGSQLARELGDALPILIGGVLALLLTGMLRVITQQEEVNFWIVLIGIIPLGAIVWISRGWIERGTLPKSWLAIAAAALTLNLTAAGGISFPGVAGSWYLLAALAMPSARPRQLHETWQRMLPAAAALGLLVLVVNGAYLPTMTARGEIGLAHEMIQRGNLPAAVDYFETAAQADRWDDEPHRMLAELYYQAWMARPEESTRRQFDAAIQRARQRVPFHYQSHYRLGMWHLGFYRRGDDPDDLAKAIGHFREAANLFPSRASHHSQLAWVLHLAGQNQEAAEAATEAARLDEINPHIERKLENLPVEDVRLPEIPAGQIPPPDSGHNAKQIVDRLRTMEE